MNKEMLGTKRHTKKKMSAVRDRLLLKLMLVMISETRNESDGAREAWVDAVERKMHAVGVKSLQGFVRSIMVLNRKFVRGGHRQMHVATLQAMFEETCDALFGPEEMDEAEDMVEAEVVADKVVSEEASKGESEAD